MIFLSDLCGREEYSRPVLLSAKFLSDLCGREGDGGLLPLR